MGEAKRKRQHGAGMEEVSRPISPTRFNVYAIGARLSPTRWMAEERSYWSDRDERALGLVFRDRTDDDYGWCLFARDKVGRFRCTDIAASLRSEAYATRMLRLRIARAVAEGDFLALGDQKDETNYPTDLLRVDSGTPASKLHPFFRAVMEAPGRAPSRAVLKEIGPWLAPSDPHFVSEFQEKQFDQRLWELYLWAVFRDLGFDVTQPEAPDFLCRSPLGSFTAEATTVTASHAGPLAVHPEPKTPDEMREFLAHYMPMKFGSSLTSKLNKKNRAGESYWERGPTADKPFILAVADFHIPGSGGEIGSMTYSQSALAPYLYGHRVDWEFADGQLVVRAVPLEGHAYRGKSIPTGFFDLPGAENISAVIFSNAGTLAKFDRIGVLAGFGAPSHRYFRAGRRYDPDPNAVLPKPLMQEVLPGAHEESWADEVQVFHNPNAKRPLGLGMFQGVTQHFFEEGNHHATTPADTVLSSWTMILDLTDGEPASDAA